jgi:hypothetical protein
MPFFPEIIRTGDNFVTSPADGAPAGIAPPPASFQQRARFSRRIGRRKILEE